MQSAGAEFDLSGCVALENLGIDFNPEVLSDIVSTITSTKAFKRVFINLGPDHIKADKQPEGSERLWAKIDAHLAAMSSLDAEGGVTFTMVISSCIAGMMGVSHFKSMFDEWKDEVLQFGKQKLPACEKKGLLRVVQVVGQWSSGPFGDAALPE